MLRLTLPLNRLTLTVDEGRVLCEAHCFRLASRFLISRLKNLRL